MTTRALELKIPPVAVVLLIAGLMGLGAWALPSLTFAFPGRAFAAGGLAGTGAVVSLLGVASFRQLRLPLNRHAGRASCVSLVPVQGRQTQACWQRS